VKKLFCSVNFFSAKIFSGILENGNLSEQKILAGKNSLSKKGFPLLNIQIICLISTLFRKLDKDFFLSISNKFNHSLIFPEFPRAIFPSSPALGNK
jgi:hypothetical protein